MGGGRPLIIAHADIDAVMFEGFQGGLGKLWLVWESLGVTPINRAWGQFDIITSMITLGEKFWEKNLG